MAIKNIRVSLSTQKTEQQYNSLIREYVELSYMILDCNNTGDTHTANVLKASQDEIKLKLGQWILDHQIGGGIV